jgi:hypothetical protein
LNLIIKEAVPEDVDFLRSGLAELDREIMELAKSSGTTAGEGGGIGPRIEHMLRSELFLIAVRDQERCGFLSISFPFPRPDKTLSNSAAASDGDQPYLFFRSIEGWE